MRPSQVLLRDVGGLGDAVDAAGKQLHRAGRKGNITVRDSKNRTFHEIPVHAGRHEHLKIWINDERPARPGAGSPALLLHQPWVDHMSRLVFI